MKASFANGEVQLEMTPLQAIAVAASCKIAAIEWAHDNDKAAAIPAEVYLHILHLLQRGINHEHGHLL